MAVTHLTLEEAAERLGISPEEFKRRLKTDAAFKTLDRGKIRDGTSFRFKDTAVDELARELGSGSDPAMPAVADEPLNLGGDDDVFSLTADEPAPKPTPKKPAKGPDSDIRLDASAPKSGKTAKANEAIPTEEIAIEFSGPPSAIQKKEASSTKLSAPRSSTKLTSDSGKKLSKAEKGDDSEFELSLDADSDDFELKLGGDAGSDEDDAIDLGEMPKDVPGGSRVGRGGESGILSRKPNDTGRSLEKGGKSKTKLPAASEDAGDIDFELTLDSAAAGGLSSTRLGGKPKKPAASTDSEFELTLDDAGSGSLEHAALDGDSESEASKGDIFETDFEIPPMEESGSEAVAVESADTDLDKSDFDVAIDDSDVVADTDASGSEVVLLEDDEEDDAPKSKKGKSKKAAVADTEDDSDAGDVDLADVEPVDEDEDAGIAGALKGVKGKPAGEDSDDDLVPAGEYRPVPWGVVPALFLLPALALTLLGGLMGFELLQTMWGYQQPQKPSAPLIREIAKSLEMELKDQ